MKERTTLCKNSLVKENKEKNKNIDKLFINNLEKTPDSNKKCYVNKTNLKNKNIENYINDIIILSEHESNKNDIKYKMKNTKNNNLEGSQKEIDNEEKYLEHTWAFLFDREQRICYEQYVKCLVHLESFNSIRNFYKNYKFIKSPSNINSYYNIYLFKYNYRPLYEEYPNGFICIIKNINYFKNNIADLTWEKMVLLTIGENFEINELIGIQLCIRETEIFFKVWMKYYTQYLKTLITKKLNELLDLPSNTFIIIKIMANNGRPNKMKNYLKDNNDKGTFYHKNNKAYNVSLKKNSFKNKTIIPNYLNMYKTEMEPNFFPLNNIDYTNPYFHYSLNLYNQQINNYTDNLLGYNYQNNFYMNNEIIGNDYEENYMNQINGIVKKKNKYRNENKNYDNKNIYPQENLNEIIENEKKKN